jgi:hypothetical protein
MKKRRSKHGGWIPYAREVQPLVDAGENILEACRMVATIHKLPDFSLAVIGIRSAYYRLPKSEDFWT